MSKNVEKWYDAEMHHDCAAVRREIRLHFLIDWENT